MGFLLYLLELNGKMGLVRWTELESGQGKKCAHSRCRLCEIMGFVLIWHVMFYSFV